eukprot:TRINITY_DN5546_c0_g1_i1.p1 TRINITY_DN5546_c0_g1~~TRINITY_DN5546_c0_g1_i1.p1  ORF type:complete len:770 (+),score=247.40 TRINITY_DN5546_c0_g1_i1:2-2311(+)
MGGPEGEGAAAGSDQALVVRLQAEHLAERERVREKERELERERQRERERAREADLRAEAEFEVERKLMLERRQNLETEMELELESERMREEQRRLEWEEEREREWQFFQDMELQRERAWERDRELERERMQLRLAERDQETRLERELDRQRLEERNREYELERQRWREMAEQRELEMERERAALRQLQEQRERELERDMEHVRIRQRELDERARRQFELRLLQERTDMDEAQQYERESLETVERCERRTMALDWERELQWQREKSRERQMLQEREERYSEAKLRDLQRLEEFEVECARLRQRESEFEEQRRREWELEREVEREREREWALERHHEIERQQAWEYERMLQREREEDRLVLEDLFADQLLLEDVEWDERKAIMRTEAEALQDLIMEFLAVPAEEIFAPEMTEAERLVLEEELQREHEEEYAALAQEIEQHNAEAQEVWHALTSAAEESQRLGEERLSAAVADLTVEYRAWVTALICEEERQRRMILTAERLERGVPPPPPMTSAEWEVAMAWNQHQRELLETHYAADPPAFLLQLQQLQFQYLMEQRALRDQIEAAAREAHQQQVAQWNAYIMSRSVADSQRRALDEAAQRQSLAAQHAAMVQQEVAARTADLGRDPAAYMQQQYDISPNVPQSEQLARVGAYRPQAFLPRQEPVPGLPGQTYAGNSSVAIPPPQHHASSSSAYYTPTSAPAHSTSPYGATGLSQPAPAHGGYGVSPSQPGAYGTPAHYALAGAPVAGHSLSAPSPYSGPYAGGAPMHVPR